MDADWRYDASNQIEFLCKDDRGNTPDTYPGSLPPAEPFDVPGYLVLGPPPADVAPVLAELVFYVPQKFSIDALS